MHRNLAKSALCFNNSFRQFLIYKYPNEFEKVAKNCPTKKINAFVIQLKINIFYSFPSLKNRLNINVLTNLNYLTLHIYKNIYIL